jgi:hypothetical protein
MDIVKHIILNHVNHYFKIFRFMFHQVYRFAFKMTEEAFHTGVIPAIALSRHALGH